MHAGQMEKVCIVFMLAMSVGRSQVCRLQQPSVKANTSAYVQLCIAECLGLDLQGPKRICKYSETSGNVVGEKCEADFYPAKRNNKVLACYAWTPVNPYLKDLDAKIIEEVKIRNKNSAQMSDFVFYDITKYNVDKAKLELTDLTDFHFGLFRDALRIGTKMVLALGSHGDWNMAALGFMTALANDKSRAEFLNQIISVVVKYKFSGVAFHWIYPGCPREPPNTPCKFKKDKERVVGLANEVLQPLREMGLTTFYFYTVNMDISMYLGDYFSEISPHVDYFLPELASQTGHWESFIEFDNSLSVAIESLTKMARKIADKNFLSKNLYQVMVRGMQYEAWDAKKVGVKSIMDKKSSLTQQPKFAEYCQKLASPNFTHVKNESVQNYAYSGKTVIVYDGLESLRAKADFAREKMAGMSVYELHYDDSINNCGCGHSPYLRTVAEVLKGRDCILKPCF